MRIRRPHSTPWGAIHWALRLLPSLNREHHRPRLQAIERHWGAEGAAVILVSSGTPMPDQRVLGSKSVAPIRKILSAGLAASCSNSGEKSPSAKRMYLGLFRQRASGRLATFACKALRSLIRMTPNGVSAGAGLSRASWQSASD